jgi:hypothetical protein
MLYAHFIGYVSEVRYTATDKPFVKCLVRTTMGKEMEVRVFGEDEFLDLDEYSLIKVTKIEVTGGFWKGHSFLNGKRVGFSKPRFRTPMEFSVANGFDLSSLN